MNLFTVIGMVCMCVCVCVLCGRVGSGGWGSYNQGGSCSEPSFGIWSLRGSAWGLAWDLPQHPEHQNARAQLLWLPEQLPALHSISLLLSPWQCHSPGVHGPAWGRGGKGQGQEDMWPAVSTCLFWAVRLQQAREGAPIQAGSEEGLTAVPLDISEKEPGALEQQVEGAFGGWWLKDLFGSLQGRQLPALATWALAAAG